MAYEFLFANNATSTLAAALASSATTVALAPGTGVLFPAPADGQFFALTLISATTPTGPTEVVYVTELSGDTIVSMLRGQEGTTAQAWSLGDSAQALLTAGALSALASDLNVLATAPLPIASYTYAGLPAAMGYAPGTQAFCANGLNPGEAAGHGTGCPVFVKLVASVATWCAVWSGLAVEV